jgi:IgA Peptidase M64
MIAPFTAMSRLILLVLVVADLAAAEPVTTIRNNGDPANRVDIVVLGDGYTAAQLPQYAAQVNKFISGLFAQEPFRQYQRYFNVHRVDVTSNQSGAGRDVPQDTALGAFYNCSGIQRLVCVDVSAVNDVIRRSALAADLRDVIIVIVNDSEYGGSGGAVAVASTHPEIVELVLHELGHSFGLLADEYDTDPQLCDDTGEPPEPNVTAQTGRNLIKWNSGGGPPTGWIAPTTAIPTTAPAAVGLFEGARYCTTGLYRPTFDSKMRSLNRPFEEVNSEQLVKRIYNWVSPIDSSEPLASSINLTANGTQEFRVQTPAPTNDTLKVTWKVDDIEIGSGNLFSLSAVTLDPGSHTVAAVAEDLTPFVRDDPANILTDTRTWRVNVDSALVRPDTMIVSGPAPLSRARGAVFVFASTIAGSKFSCSLNGGAFSACRSPKKYPRLVNGFHTFQVTATDVQGISDTSPASHTWTVDNARPETTITLAPSATSNQASVSFQFASSESNSTFQCKLDANAYAPCTSPKTYANLLPGRHTFQVTAIDSAGNADKRAASHKWTIDLAAPETTIKGKPPAITNSTNATFRFAANQRGSTFECRLNNGAFQPCPSRYTFSVAPGAHTLEVRATDPAGNRDSSPASHSWTVQ